MGNPYETGLDLKKGNVITSAYLTKLGLDAAEIARINREIEAWKFYKGDHWSFTRPDGEPQNTINYSARFVDKGVAFLMGKGFTINVDKEAEKITKPFLDNVWDDNSRELLGVEMGQSGGVTGNAWVKIAVEEYDPKEDSFLYEMYPKGRIRLVLLPGHCCFPIWKNHDKDQMVLFRVIYPIQVMTPNGEYETVWYKEEISNTTINIYLDDKLQETKENSLGAIPVVRIKNLPVANESYGKSDLQDVIPLNKEFNEKTTDVSDIINYHASPVTLVFGAKTNNLEKGARKIWGGLPKDAKVENLELKSDLSASMDYIKLVKDSMFEVASMPEDALGAKTNVSNTSGIALHIKNQPLIDTNNTKRITYGQGIVEINRIILKYAEIFEFDEFDLAGFNSLKPAQKWKQEITFPDPLPKDELIQMQLIVQKLTNGLTTRIDALKELGEHDAATKYEEIKKEFVEWQNLMFDSMGGMGATGGATAGTTGTSTNQPNIGGIVRDGNDLHNQPNVKDVKK